MTRPEARRRDAHAAAEMRREKALIAEPMRLSNGCHRVPRQYKGLRGKLNAHPQRQFIGSDAKGFVDAAVQGPL